MDEMRRAATANDGTRSSKRSYFTITLKAMLIKVSEWLRCLGASI